MALCTLISSNSLAKTFAFSALLLGLVISTPSPAQTQARPSQPKRPVLLISDIDDTIKRTNVLSKKGMLIGGPQSRNPFAGMNSLYNFFACHSFEGDHLNRCMSHQAMERSNSRLVAYVSSAPGRVQMISTLFLKNSLFPVGPVFARDFDFSISAVIAALAWSDFSSSLPDSYDFKVNAIKKLLVQYSEYDVILIGDNGEKDVAVYAEINRWAREAQPRQRIDTFIHQVYAWDKGVQPAEGQIMYVTSGDLALEFYKRGLITEDAVVYLANRTIDLSERDKETLFPKFMNCRPFAEQANLEVPQELGYVARQRAEKMLDIIRSACLNL